MNLSKRLQNADEADKAKIIVFLQSKNLKALERSYFDTTGVNVLLKNAYLKS